MYIEVSEKKLKRMEEEFKRRHISYTVTPCTLPTDKTIHYHFDFLNNPDTARVIHAIYEQVTKELQETKQITGDITGHTLERDMER